MKQTIYLIALMLLTAGQLQAQHNAGHNGKILMIASNPAVSKQTGWPIGAWYAEVTHPYWAFTEAGYTVDIASPDGGEVKFDGFSDPEDASQYAAFDYISLGFAAYLCFMKPVFKEGFVYFGQRNGKFYPIQDEKVDYFYEKWKHLSVENVVNTILQDKNFCKQAMDIHYLEKDRKSVV